VCDPLAVSENESLTKLKNVTANNPDSESCTYFFHFLLVVAFIYFVDGSVVNARLFNEIGISMIPQQAIWCSIKSRFVSMFWFIFNK